MGIDDRDWNREERSGAGRFFSRIFENVENPLGWSLKLFTFRGITTRAHIFLVLYLVTMPLFSIDQNAQGFVFMFMMMLALFGIVLLHEFGHCFACRWVGGTADRIVLLPWGGLALVMPPNDWRSHLITVVGGPAVHILLLPIFVGAMIAAGLSSALIFNPFNIWAELSAPGFQSSSNLVAYLKYGLFSIYYINLLLFVFNVFVPAFPLDGGRIVQALLWRKMGYRKSMEAAVLIGFFGAGVLLIIGLALNQVFLAVIAAFCGITCYTERQRVRAEAMIVGDAGPGVFQPDGSISHPPQQRDRGPSKREMKAREKARQDEHRLDELLDKIRDHGMHSLSKKERATLDRLSKERREG